MARTKNLLVAMVAVTTLVTGMRSAGANPSAAAPAQRPSGPEWLQSALPAYLEIQEMLARDEVKGVPEAARKIEAAVKGIDARMATELGVAAGKLAAAKDLAAARQAFRAVSDPLVAWATKTSPAGLSVVHCGMAKASWVQRGPEVRNPYHGSEMLRCGRVVAGEGAKPGGEHGHGH